MRRAFKDVLEFEEANGNPSTHGRPAVPERKVAELYRGLIEEEASETFHAITEAITTASEGGDITSALADVADGFADVIWTCMAAAIRFGIDLPEVWERVREANMAKFGPGSWRREDGKLMKPPGWTPPDVAGVLASQLPLARGYDREFEARFASDLDRQIATSMKLLWQGSPAYAALKRAQDEIERLRK